MADSDHARDAAPAARPGKRERLVAAAGELVYRQGVARTTLADIARAADVPLGNVYYYFKAKDDIVGAVVQGHVDELASGVAALERRHRTPKARLRALVRVLAERRDVIARYGCPYGTLCTELVKRTDGPDPLAAPLMQVPLRWAERQFRAMGRRDAHDLAVELVASYQGSAVLSSALGEPELMTRQARRLERWIEALDALTDPDPKGGSAS
jgi:AcrR family transcriptional regulator